MTYIFVEIRFEEYSSKEKTKDVQNGTRRALLGIRSPKIPDKVNERLGWRAITPLFFALIKEPKVYYVGGKKFFRNLAPGAIVCYSYTWYEDKIEQTIKTVSYTHLTLPTTERV